MTDVGKVEPDGRRRKDSILDVDYLNGLNELTLDQLRVRRDAAAQEETDLSYLRRLLHARIDIVRAEQERRNTSGTIKLVDQLAGILSENAFGPAGRSGRHQLPEPSQAGDSPSQAEILLDNSDLTDVGALPEEKLTETLNAYIEKEQAVSRQRRAVQAVMDTINAEIAGRYACGSASVDELLASERVRPTKNS